MTEPFEISVAQKIDLLRKMANKADQEMDLRIILEMIRDYHRVAGNNMRERD